MNGGFWAGRRVLLTGHTGFKGAWLALWLHALGAEVHGLSAPPPSSPSLYRLARVDEALASESIVDVREAGAVRAAVAAVEPEVVLHLAAQALVRRSLAEPVETFEVNVTGTANVLEASRGARAIVVVTSDKCYRDVESGRPMREDDPLGGKDPYSASKAAQELVAAAYRQTVLEGAALATVRAGNVIGGGDWAQDRLVPDLFRAALAGQPLVIRNPHAVRPWQHVLNPLSGYLAVAERLVAGEAAEAWNFGPDAGDELPVSAVVERLRARWPGELEVRVEADAAAGKEAATLRLDSAKARERLGWSPRWDLDAGLDATTEWYAAHGRGEDARSVTLGQIERFSG